MAADTVPTSSDGIPDGIPAEHWLRQDAAEAAFAPSAGFCCTAFRVRPAGQDGQWLKALAEPPSWAALRGRPAFFGNPLLFPFPMAIPGGAFTYRGERYALRPTREGRVVHGLVRDHPWTVEQTWRDARGEHIRASISTAGDGDRLAEFPFPFRLAATYTLLGPTLTLETEATNLGAQTMPLGLGIHPYVPLPLAPEAEGSRSEAGVTYSDVTHTVAVGQDGRTLDMIPARGGVDLRTGQPVPDLLASQRAQRPRGGLLLSYARGTRPPAPSPAPTEGERAWAGVHWWLEDCERGIVVEVETDPQFWVLVLFAPPEPTAVISPVLCTCLPNAFNLASHGHASGMVELAPGETWRARMRLRVRWS
ncbi:MAG: aldose 1-epimerase [Chloroflexota bacterium]